MNGKLVVFGFLTFTLFFTPFLGYAHEVHHNQALIDQGVTLVVPEDVQWGQSGFPGVELAPAFGDVNNQGDVYAIRLRLAPNAIIQPHIHSQAEYVTVISGYLNVGIGETVNKNNSIQLPPGGSVGIPANVPHYVWATEEVIIQNHAIGPRDITFVR